MEQEPASAAQREFDRARAALARENTVTALAHMEKALKLWDNKAWYSYLGFCVAKERGQYKLGLDLCRTALEQEPDNPDHYLNLGNVHLSAGNRAEALQALRDGAAKGGNDEFRVKLNELGRRRTPVFAALPRSHPLNRFLGLILSRLMPR